MKKNVSCIIVNYNSKKLTKELALKVSKYNSIDYVVIIDNNSNDGSKKELKQIQNNKIHVKFSKVNLGYAKGNNYGAEYAIKKLNSDYIIIANPDVDFSEEYVKENVKLLESDDMFYVSSAIAHDINNKVSYCSYWTLPTFFTYYSYFFPLISKLKKKNDLNKQNNYIEDYIITEAVSGALFIAKKDVFDKIGGFDEKTFLYCEESILGSKIKTLGGKEVVTYKTYYNHNHKYKEESKKQKYNSYRFLLNSRRYYLKDILKSGFIKLLLFDITSIISIFVHLIYWNIKR